MGMRIIWAVEPLGATRWIWAGISTCRPAESVMTRVSTPSRGS